MITMRQYAKQHGITYEAVRAQVARCAKDLDGHIVTEKRTKYLDDYAVEYLDARRQGNPVVVRDEEQAAELARLREENHRLSAQVIAAQATALQAMQRVDEIQTQLAAAQDKLQIAQAKAEPARPWWQRIFAKK